MGATLTTSLLLNQVAIVMGGSGIGKAIAKALAAAVRSSVWWPDSGDSGRDADAVRTAAPRVMVLLLT